MSKKKIESNIIYNSASRVSRTHVLTSAEIESFALRHRLKNWKMERNSLFQRLVGGQCGQDPRSIKVQDFVPLLTCNKDISRHKSSPRLMTGSGVDNEVELILARSSIFSFPSNMSRSSFFAGQWVAKGFGALPYTSPAVEARPQIPYYGSWNQ